MLINQQTDFTWWGGADRPNPTGAYGGSIAVNDRGVWENPRAYLP